jgi:hypothetical protein
MLFGIGIVLFTMLHDFNLDVNKGAIFQPVFFGVIGSIFLLCGLIVLMFSVFQQKPYRGKE